MKKKTKKRKIRTSAKVIVILSVASIFAIAVIGASLYNILTQIIQSNKELNEKEEVLLGLQREEEDLNNEIELLQDKDYLARYAREKYFYSKDGEVIIRMPSED